MFIFDIANFLICLIFIIVACKMRMIPIWIGLVLSIYSSMPFLMNDVLFPNALFPDQWHYFRAMENTRALNFMYSFEELIENKFIKFYITSSVLSFLPLPYVETIKSVGFFNWFLFIFVFLWLYSKRFLKGLPLLILLFYPSLVFYTSLSLRDPLILIIMIVSVVFLIDKKYLKFFIFVSPLLLLKFQNLFFMLSLFLFFIIFDKNKFNNLFRYTIFIILILVFMLFYEETLTLLDKYRNHFYRENSGEAAYYKPVDGLYQFLAQGAIGSFYYLFKPFPWEAANNLQLVQSFENLIITFLLIIFTKKSFRQSKMITIKWLSYILFVFAIYGIVIFNVGTAARYRYPFIVLYVIGLTYELYKVKAYRFQFKSKLRSINSQKD